MGHITVTETASTCETITVTLEEFKKPCGAKFSGSTKDCCFGDLGSIPT